MKGGKKKPSETADQDIWSRLTLKNNARLIPIFHEQKGMVSIPDAGGLLEWDSCGWRRQFLYLQATHPRAQRLEEQPVDWNALGQRPQP